jgi:hypothetical protein
MPSLSVNKDSPEECKKAGSGQHDFMLKTAGQRRRHFNFITQGEKK